MTADFRELVDLAGERLGASVLYASDDFFAEKENLIKQAGPVWKEHEYTDRGKWMDGWESRRKRVPGHDYAIVRLGARGVIRGAIVDTSFFRGNYPESCSMEGLSANPNTLSDELLSAGWQPILERSPLQGDSANSFTIDAPHAFTHVRLNIFPDGGVARLRLYGEVVPDWHRAGGLGSVVDLAAIENGASVLTCSDMFFGPRHNLIMPGRAHDMSDGWETKRRRGPGHDWVVVRLAVEGSARRIEIDTNHFKGNYPDSASIEASTDGEQWRPLLARTKLQGHTRHFFGDELLDGEPASYLRLNVYPDGGVSRLRVWGTASENGRRAAVVTRINTLTDAELREELRSCCASSSWVDEMARQRPYGSWNELSATSDRVWRSRSSDDWQEAFRAHPRIGETESGARWTAAEQSGTRSAAPETLTALAQRNRQYESRFGHVYLVCATGRSAGEMLADLEARMKNDRPTELAVAAEEQRKITELRLEKLVL